MPSEVRVAAHAHRERRHSGRHRAVGAGVTVEAVDLVHARVVGVAERNGLLRPRSGVVPGEVLAVAGVERGELAIELGGDLDLEVRVVLLGLLEPLGVADALGHLDALGVGEAIGGPSAVDPREVLGGLFGNVLVAGGSGGILKQPTDGHRDGRNPEPGPEGSSCRAVAGHPERRIPF